MKNKKETQVHEDTIVIRWNWKKIIAAIIGVIFVPSVIVFFTSLVLRTTLINPSYYKNNFTRIDAYERMINEGIPSLIFLINISDNSLTDTIAKDVSILLLQKFIDPAWIKHASDILIDATIKYLTKENQEITLNLTAANEYFMKASQGLLVIGELLPLCKEIKDKRLVSALCTQVSVNPEEIKKDIDGIRKNLETIHLEAVKLDEIVRLIHADISIIRTIAADIRLYLTISAIILALLMVCIVGLFWKQKTIIVRIVSLYVGVGSFFTLVGSVVIDQYIPRTIGASRTIVLPSSVQTIMQDFLEVSISGVFERLEVSAAIVLVISGIFFTLTYLRRT